MARRSRNQRSADSLVRVLLGRCVELADKAVRAPGESSRNTTKLGDGTAENAEGRGEKLQTVLCAGRRPALGARIKLHFHVLGHRGQHWFAHGLSRLKAGAPGSAGLRPACGFRITTRVR